MNPPMNPLGADWDAIVIGTGIGGGTAARALAEAGLRVLILEQGPEGYRHEETALDLDMPDPVARRLRGFWPEPVEARLGGQVVETFAPLGAGLGGSSVFYAATLERPEPHDLDDSAPRPHPTGGWPVSYATLAPYLDEAERRFAVKPARLSPGEEALAEDLRARGLSPTPLHQAIARVEGCRDCLGHKCPRACKMDGRSAGVEPALATGRAALVSDCEVLRIEAEAGRVTALTVRHRGETHRLKARRYVLAGGALGSARLMLASGLGNSSGLVGRGLMFHLNEMLAVWPRVKIEGAAKGLGFRDLYWQAGNRLGMVQAMGLEAGYGEILHALRLASARGPLRHLPMLDKLLPFPAAWGERLLGRAQVFVGLLEDLPYDDNRVIFDPSRPEKLIVSYGFAPELLARRKRFRRAMRRAFRGYFPIFLNHGPEPNLGHPCGTLRMGADPARSVVDATGRVNEAPNLFVADASVFPTSMGVNPSLTIAAHALHMAEHLVNDMKERGA